MLQLKVYDGVLVEKLQVLFGSGLCITINSDDPAYFGGYILDNYEYIIEALNLPISVVFQLHKNAFKAAFLSDAKRQHYMTLLESTYKEFQQSA